MRIFNAMAAFAGICLAAAAASADVVNQTWRGVAIDGYDPVAYFTEGGPVEGDKAHSLTWNGAEWRFSSADNKARFEAEPEKYAPQYGGYCAYAVAKNSTAGIDPDAWTIVDGKLYLNYSKGVQSKWEADIPGYLAQSEANWPAIEADLKD